MAPKKGNTRVQTKAEAAADYGYTLAVIQSNKELNDLFNESWAALKNTKVADWSTALFTSKLRKTDWFINRTAKEREFYVLENDPSQSKTLESTLAKAQLGIRTLASKAGAVLTEAQEKRLARESKLNDWTDLETTDALNKYINYKKDPTSSVKALFGQAGSTETTLRTFAKSMGVNVTDNWVLKEARAASITGDTKLAEEWIRSRSKEIYKPYANDLDTSNLEDLSYNYRKKMADLLELDADNIKPSDPTIARFMSTPTDKGEKQSLWDFEKQIRKDPRWQKTKNATESANSTVNSILSSFGLM